MKHDLVDELTQAMGQEMQREIDREILWGMLADLGWTRVMLPPFTSNEQAVDICTWTEDNCTQGWESSGRDYIFEDQKEAHWFMLRWLS